MAYLLNSLFRNPQGYLVKTDPDPTKSKGQQGLVECATITCGHCGRIVEVPAMCKAHEMTYAMCWGCRRNICLPCDTERARTLKCDVIENKLERWEAGARLSRDVRGQ